MLGHDYSQFTDESLNRLIKSHEALETQRAHGGNWGHNIAFILGLLGIGLGAAGVLHGAIGDASPQEFQIACIALIIGIPAGYIAHRNDKAHQAQREEYLALLRELDQRNKGQ